ncbi:selenocysteine-specific translation elongation factor [Sulfurospirillum sp. 1612]|uniref:selenocysteine-specific translation elongation factor n=1 Tax=Sulfurospirillum sp. 1612 TaxID=3094835 RepID=UPI002F93F147
MKYIIVGTAGHVDHGKTALIEAMTGFSGDSLEEEKRRGITIDLSFSHLQNDDINVAFIDVPGHEKLLKNMIAGAFGFDASLVVVDANEGLKPQTIEHLEILNLLHVKNIIIALTKSDLATDEILTTRESEIREYIKTLQNLEIFDLLKVSIYDQDSIQKLKESLFSLPLLEKESNGLFRYYIDRSFSLSGVGQVVTGTVLDGSIAVGDKIFAPELNQEFKIKNLQVHDHDVPNALSSQRTAINLQGTLKSPLKRGTLLCKKGFIKGFNNVDAWVEGIASHKIKHNTSVNLFIGTKQVEAKILLLEGVEPIERGFATLCFKQKLFLVHNEPFILSTSGRTIGGGRILNPINDPLKKRVKLELLSALRDDDFDRAFSILSSTHKRGFGLISSNQRFGLSHDEAIAVADRLDDVFVDEQGLVIYPTLIKTELKQIIKNIYAKNQYALLSPASLSLKIKWASVSLLQDILTTLCDEGLLKLENGIYKNAEIKIDDINKLIEDKIFETLEKSDITPDAPYNIYDALDIDKKIGDNALKNLTKARKVVRLAHNLFVTSQVLSKIVAKMRDIMLKEGYIDISSFKKHFNISRKYLVAYLDYLDEFDDINKQDNRRSLI